MDLNCDYYDNENFSKCEFWLDKRPAIMVSQEEVLGPLLVLTCFALM